MTLLFPYRAFPTVKIAGPLSSQSVQVIRYRSVIPIRIASPSIRSAGVFIGDAFADPGSDFTIVQRQFASILGLSEFVHQMNHRWKGIDYPVRFCRLSIEVTDGGTTLSWPAAIGFTDAPLPYGCLLGLTGFFEFLDVRFLGMRRQLEIEQNSLFGQVGGVESS